MSIGSVSSLLAQPLTAVSTSGVSTSSASSASSSSSSSASASTASGLTGRDATEEALSNASESIDETLLASLGDSSAGSDGASTMANVAAESDIWHGMTVWA